MLTTQLPASADVVEGQGPPEPTGEQNVVPRRKRLVWIVDDSPLDAEMTVKAIEGVFATRVFADGAQMLEQLDASPLPDVLILDWVMPRVSGIEVCRFLRTTAEARELSILMLTVQNKTQQVVEALGAGADDFLSKPYSREELVARVSSLMRATILREQAEGAGQQAAALALQKTERRYRALIEGLTDIVLVISGGRIAFLSPPAIELFANGSGEAIIGKPVETLFHADEREDTMARIAEVVAGNRLPLHERRMLRHDGSDITVELSAHPLVFDNELAVIAIARDTSEQKRSHQQLMIAERMASIGMLAAGVAHEINNPLASVLANLDYALAELRRFSDGSIEFDDFAESLSEARLSGQRMRTIVRDLKTFSRSEDAEHRGPVVVQTVLESCLRMAANEIRHRAQVVKEYSPVPPVLANEARLGQVFLNLIVNAAQAIPEGQAESNQLRVVTRTIGNQVAIDVCDSGQGMTPAVLQKLFTPFFTTKPAGLGTGIGLSICHRIISGLGGEIRVSSQVGKGTTFTVLLPATTADEAAVEVILPAALPGPRGKVLIVDDEQAIVRVIELTLGREHEVVAVASGQLAMEKMAAGQRFDVILCDLMMPQMTGMELYSRVLELDAEQASRIIFLSGGTFTRTAANFLDSVVNQRIEKPFDLQQLRGIVSDRVLAIAKS